MIVNYGGTLVDTERLDQLISVLKDIVAGQKYDYAPEFAEIAERMSEIGFEQAEAEVIEKHRQKIRDKYASLLKPGRVNA